MNVGFAITKIKEKLSRDIWQELHFVQKSGQAIILCTSGMNAQGGDPQAKDNLILGDSPLLPIVERTEDLFPEKGKGKEVPLLLLLLGQCQLKLTIT